jgi:hypothetical protein
MPARFGVFLALIKQPASDDQTYIHCPDLGLVCTGFSAFSLTNRTWFQQCGCRNASGGISWEWNALRALSLCAGENREPGKTPAIRMYVCRLVQPLTFYVPLRDRV